MNFFAYLLNYNKFSSTVKLGTQMQSLEQNGVTGIPENISTVFTCYRILCENISRMPISIFADNSMGRLELTQHRLYYLLRYAPNGSQNSQQFWSTVEYHRSKFGNGLVRVHKDSNAFPTRLEIIHPSRLESVNIVDGEIISYQITDTKGNSSAPIQAGDLLHFRNISEDGYIGLSTLEALKRQTNINERATSTIDNFYKNNATSPIALETDIPGNLSGSAQQVVKETRDAFLAASGGPENAGKPIMLPAFTKLQKIAVQFADAQLIDTLGYAREEIAAAHGIPLFMLDGSAEKLDIEQLTTLFRTNTIGPIVAIYISELTSKLLTRDEILNKGFQIEFDTSVVIGMDYQKKVAATKEQVVNGMMTPNEAARKLGNKTIPGEFGNMHFMQAQYIPLEKYTEYNTLKKVDPTLKTNKDNNTQPPQP